MENVKFDQGNFEIGAGENKECDSLTAGFAIDGHGYRNIVSKFKLTKEELEEINEKGEIWVSIRGVSIAPFFVTPFNPYDKFDFKVLGIDNNS